jgi:hypothetical protein
MYVLVGSMRTLQSHKAGPLSLINEYQAPPGHIYAAHNSHSLLLLYRIV